MLEMNKPFFSVHSFELKSLMYLDSRTKADTGGWRGDIRHPLTDSGRGVAPPEISRQKMFPIW